MTVLITLFFFFNDTATTEIYTLSPHDALPISKVFVDGRSDFYGQDLLETYAQVVEVKPGWDAVLKQFDVRFVLVDRKSTRLNSSHSQITYADFCLKKKLNTH